MSKELFWKKVFVDHSTGSMVSCYADYPWQLKYEIGKTTVPRQGKIWVSKGTNVISAAKGFMLLQGTTSGEPMDIDCYSIEVTDWPSYWLGGDRSTLSWIGRFPVKSREYRMHCWVPDFTPNGVCLYPHVTGMMPGTGVVWSTDKPKWMKD